jgi:ribosomal protein S18 acetylase RimI-like enzyme
MGAMIIRPAALPDAPAIARLLGQLGYPVTEDLIRRKLALLLKSKDEDLLVGEEDGGNVVGFLAMHCIPQVAMEGAFARISYLCVDEKARGQGIGTQLEGEACRLAAIRGCDRIELHCHSRRTKAHRFYACRGYLESPKYFAKTL